MEKKSDDLGEDQNGIQFVQAKRNWQQHEDFGLAYQMQNNEFLRYYDQNRSERRLMHDDICLSKEEQMVEDGYAAAYFEQLRRDQMKEDERLAQELQRRLSKEEQLVRLAKEQEDLALAHRLQKCEIGDKTSDVPSCATQATTKSSDMALGITKSPSGSRLVLPPGVTPELLAVLDNEPISLPPGFTPEHVSALEQASLEEDRRLAGEVQDYELARFMERNGKPFKFKPNLLPHQSARFQQSKSKDEDEVYSVVAKKPQSHDDVGCP